MAPNERILTDLFDPNANNGVLVADVLAAVHIVNGEVVPDNVKLALVTASGNESIGHVVTRLTEGVNPKDEAQNNTNLEILIGLIATSRGKVGLEFVPFQLNILFAVTKYTIEEIDQIIAERI